LSANSLGKMLEAELNKKLGDEPFEIERHNSGDNLNGSFSKNFPVITNELEDETIGKYP
jgi:hypothetical protein